MNLSRGVLGLLLLALLAVIGCGPKQQEVELGPVSQETQEAIQRGESAPPPVPEPPPGEPPGAGGQEEGRVIR